MGLAGGLDPTWTWWIVHGEHDDRWLEERVLGVAPLRSVGRGAADRVHRAGLLLPPITPVARSGAPNLKPLGEAQDRRYAIGVECWISAASPRAEAIRLADAGQTPRVALVAANPIDPATLRASRVPRCSQEARTAPGTASSRTSIRADDTGRRSVCRQALINCADAA